MKIEHLAIWTYDLEKMKHFYTKYFNMTCSEKYESKDNEFSSYFLSFIGAESRIELMHKPSISGFDGNKADLCGLTHFSISVGSEEKVNELTELLRSDEYIIVREPRKTGDGYYESVFMDCERNLVELSE